MSFVESRFNSQIFTDVPVMLQDNNRMSPASPLSSNDVSIRDQLERALSEAMANVRLTVSPTSMEPPTTLGIPSIISPVPARLPSITSPIPEDMPSKLSPAPNDSNTAARERQRRRSSQGRRASQGRRPSYGRRPSLVTVTSTGKRRKNSAPRKSPMKASFVTMVGPGKPVLPVMAIERVRTTATIPKPNRMSNSSVKSQGLSNRTRVKNAMQVKKMNNVRVDALYNKPLPATPKSATLKPVSTYKPVAPKVGLPVSPRPSRPASPIGNLSTSPKPTGAAERQHGHRRSASSVNILPSPSLKVKIPRSPLSGAKTNHMSPSRLVKSPVVAVVTSPGAGPGPDVGPAAGWVTFADLEDSPIDPTAPTAPGTARLSLCSLRLRNGSVVTVVPPERTAWRQNAYLPGPIKLRPKGIQDDDGHAHLGKFGASLDLFKEEHPTVQPGKGEDMALDDVVTYMESFGFEPVCFTADEFWHDSDQRTTAAFTAHHRSNTTTTSGPALSLYPSNRRTHNRSASGTMGWVSHKPGGSDSSSDWVSHKPSGSQSSFGSATGSESWLTSGGKKDIRVLPPSPGAPAPPPKLSGFTYKGRKSAAGRRSATVPGRDGKIGLMRLIRGAGSIV